MNLRRLILALLVLNACGRESARPTPKAPAPLASAAPAVAPSPIASTTPAQPEPEPEAPLPWGTRPPREGPLFPVIDGPCGSHGVRPVGDAVLYVGSQYRGAWTRGGRASFGRFTDDGIVRDADMTVPASKSDAKAIDDIEEPAVFGTWPQPLVLLSTDRGSGRTRALDSVWTRDAAGWKQRTSSITDDGRAHTTTLYRGHVITARTAVGSYGEREREETSAIATWKLTPEAPAIAGITGLARSHFQVATFAAASDESAIYALGADEQQSIVRWVRDGKAGEVTFAGTPDIGLAGTTPTALFVILDSKSLERIEGGKRSPVALDLPAGITIRGAQIARDGAAWVLGSDNVITVRRGDHIEKTPLPKPARAMPKEERPAMSRFASARLVGVDHGEPYAIGEGGTLFHLAGGTWSEVAMPTPPFATNGRYQAEALTLAAPGDLFVQASYLEKGVGWPGALRYRALLRSKRPKEVLRCNETITVDPYETGADFMSFPPIATETCTTPFVILLRTAFNLDTTRPAYVFDRKTDFPTVRTAIKATPSLGESVDLVEVQSGAQRYLGARVPNIAAGKELALAVVKRVETMIVHTPEVVCGVPKEERVIHVDVATGKVK